MYLNSVFFSFLKVSQTYFQEFNFKCLFSPICFSIGFFFPSFTITVKKSILTLAQLDF